MVEAICALLDQRLPAGAPHARLITPGADRPGQDRRHAIDPTRISSELGWQLWDSFEQGGYGAGRLGCAARANQPILVRTTVRTSGAMGESRFEVRLNQRLADDFDQVARSSGLSRVEVFRRAIALYKTVKQEEVQQGHVILRSRDGAERELMNF